MYLKHRQTGNLVEIVDSGALVDPCQDDVPGCYHAGEEMQDREPFAKHDLMFPSGEALPRCWLDPHYKH